MRRSLVLLCASVFVLVLVFQTTMVVCWADRLRPTERPKLAKQDSRERKPADKLEVVLKLVNNGRERKLRLKDSVVSEKVVSMLLESFERPQGRSRRGQEGKEKDASREGRGQDWSEVGPAERYCRRQRRFSCQ